MVVVVESMSITAFEKIGSPPDYTKSKTFPLLGSAKQWTEIEIWIIWIQAHAPRWTASLHQTISVKWAISEP